jgi:para-aminobenzoate synthetase component 1
LTESYLLFDQGPDGGAQAFADPERVIVAWNPSGVAEVFAAMQAARDAGKWLAGYASYELGYCLEPKLASLMPQGRRTPLMCFGVFGRPDPVVARSLIHQGKLSESGASLSAPVPDWSEADYASAFAKVRDYIAAGDFYQTNLTFPMTSRFSGSPLGLYSALRRGQPVKHGALVNLGHGPLILSRSPELFFKVGADGVIETRPMKGTVPRGDNPQQDAELINFLRNDAKNRAENLMIVDLLRNDMSRISELGTVVVPELFTVETYATVHQMTSRIQAQMIPETTIAEAFAALFPCGSVTGAPKVRAMEVIRELEPAPRDIYCGSIGWLAPSGAASFNVAIRTLSLYDDGQVTLNVGGGVVYDSTAASEYEEALWKARYTKLLNRT